MQTLCASQSPRYEFIGHSGSWVVDQWLITWELSYEHGRQVNVSQDPPFPTGVANLINGLVGVRYTGVTDLVLSLELQRAFLLTELTEMLFDVEALNIAFLASYTTMSERLELSLAWLMSGAEAEYGWLVRGDVGWRVVDGLRIGLGYISYQPGDEIGPFYGLETHDRLLMGVRWDFQLM